MIAERCVSAETFVRGLAVVNASGVEPVIQAEMTSRTGRRRVQPWRAILTVLAITALEGNGSLLLSRAASVAERLSDAQRESLSMTHPMTYAQIESAVADLDVAMTERVHPLTGEVLPPRLSIDLTAFMTRVATGLIPAQITRTSTLSLDSTDYETHYRRRSWKHHMKPDVAATALPEDDFEPAKPTVNEPGWPRAGDDGRLQHSVDPDARDGYRAGKNKSRKGVFVGWDLHLAVDTPALGERGCPPLVRAASLAPAGSDKATAGRAVLDALDGGPACTTLLADRGYTYLDSQRWALPIHRLGIDQVIDLHTSQRKTRPGPIPGTFYLDGGLFVTHLPKRLHDLSAFSLGMTAEQTDTLCATYDERAPYAFTPLGKPDRERGTQRYRGPALTGRVRCPNTPASMRLDPAKRPTTPCVEGEPCACGTTVTLGPDDYFATRQRLLYGTTAWKASYGRRSAVESANANLKAHHAELRRGSTRVMGTRRTGILLAFILAAVNASVLLSRYGYDLAAPTDASEPLTPKPTPRPARHRSRDFARRPKRRKQPPGRAPTRSTSPARPDSFEPIT